MLRGAARSGGAVAPAARGQRSGLGREVVVTLATGVGCGVLLGGREGLATLASNAFANPEHHALAFVVVPIAVWSILGPVLAMLVAILARFWGGCGVAACAGALAGIGTLLGLIPWLDDALEQMHASGAKPDAGFLAVVGTVTLCASLAVALVVRAAVEAWERSSPRLLRCAAVSAAIVAVLSLGWTGRFVLARLSPPDAFASREGVAPARVESGAEHARDVPVNAPNVVLISIDTLRADVLGAYGGRVGTTPALDRLAAEGVVFESALTPAPWTLPALASAMTGLLPRNHGAGAITNRLDPLGRAALDTSVTTLARTLAANGWQTQAIVTNPYLLPQFGLGAGFAAYENLTFLSEAAIAGRTNAGQWLLRRLAPGLVVGDRGSEVSERAVRWLADADRGRPFFLWLHYIDPHGPYGGAGTTRHKSFRGDSFFGAATSAAPLDVRSPEPVRLRSGEVRLGPEEREAVRALYRSEVAEVDRQVGRVFDALDARGLRASTLVVILSDHGEEFWEHGGVEHGHSLYDEVLRVVLLLRWPGELPAGARVGSLVSLVDLVPTLHELLGLEPPLATDGISLVPAIRGDAMPPRTVLSENLLFAEERVAARTAETKLVRWANGKEEAYDLVRDPAELRDLAGVEAFVSPLRAALDEAGDPSHLRANAAPIPVEALRALGYVR